MISNQRHVGEANVIELLMQDGDLTNATPSPDGS
jgi:hypothetical protein